MKTSLFLGDTEFEIKFNYYAGRPGRNYGDHPYPPDPEEVEIDTITVGGQDVTEFIQQYVYDRCVEKATEDGSADYHEAVRYAPRHLCLMGEF